MGFDNMTMRERHVKQAIEQAKRIRSNVQELAMAKDKAVLLAHGLVVSSSSDEASEQNESDVSSSADICEDVFVPQEDAKAPCDYKTHGIDIKVDV